MNKPSNSAPAATADNNIQTNHLSTVLSNLNETLRTLPTQLSKSQASGGAIGKAYPKSPDVVAAIDKLRESNVAAIKQSSSFGKSTANFKDDRDAKQGMNKQLSLLSEIQQLQQQQLAQLESLRGVFSDENSEAGGFFHAMGTGFQLLMPIFAGGKYKRDIVRSSNPFITMTSALMEQYRWQRLYGELTKRQLNELIKLQGGETQDVIGKRGVFAEYLQKNRVKLLNQTAKWLEKKEKKGQGGKVGTKAVRLGHKALSGFLGDLLMMDMEQNDEKMRVGSGSAIDKAIESLSKREKPLKKVRLETGPGKRKANWEKIYLKYGDELHEEIAELMKSGVRPEKAYPILAKAYSEKQLKTPKSFLKFISMLGMIGDMYKTVEEKTEEKGKGLGGRKRKRKTGEFFNAEELSSSEKDMFPILLSIDQKKALLEEKGKWGSSKFLSNIDKNISELLNVVSKPAKTGSFNSSTAVPSTPSTPATPTPTDPNAKITGLNQGAKILTEGLVKVHSGEQIVPTPAVLKLEKKSLTNRLLAEGIRYQRAMLKLAQETESEKDAGAEAAKESAEWDKVGGDKKQSKTRGILGGIAGGIKDKVIEYGIKAGIDAAGLGTAYKVGKGFTAAKGVAAGAAGASKLAPLGLKGTRAAAEAGWMAKAGGTLVKTSKFAGEAAGPLAIAIESARVLKLDKATDKDRLDNYRTFENATTKLTNAKGFKQTAAAYGGLLKEGFGDIGGMLYAMGSVSTENRKKTNVEAKESAKFADEGKNKVTNIKSTIAEMKKSGEITNKEDESAMSSILASNKYSDDDKDFAKKLISQGYAPVKIESYIKARSEKRELIKNDAEANKVNELIGKYGKENVLPLYNTLKDTAVVEKILVEGNKENKDKAADKQTGEKISRLIKTNPDKKDVIIKLISKGWSPEQIASDLHMDSPDELKKAATLSKDDRNELEEQIKWKEKIIKQAGSPGGVDEFSKSHIEDTKKEIEKLKAQLTAGDLDMTPAPVSSGKPVADISGIIGDIDKEKAAKIAEANKSVASVSNPGAVPPVTESSKKKNTAEQNAAHTIAKMKKGLKSFFTMGLSDIPSATSTGSPGVIPLPPNTTVTAQKKERSVGDWSGLASGLLSGDGSMSANSRGRGREGGPGIITRGGEILRTAGDDFISTQKHKAKDIGRQGVEGIKEAPGRFKDSLINTANNLSIGDIISMSKRKGGVKEFGKNALKYAAMNAGGQTLDAADMAYGASDKMIPRRYLNNLGGGGMWGGRRGSSHPEPVELPTSHRGETIKQTALQEQLNDYAIAIKSAKKMDKVAEKTELAQEKSTKNLIQNIINVLSITASNGGGGGGGGVTALPLWRNIDSILSGNCI